MKPITRTLISMYTAAHLVLSGCATNRHTSSRPYKVDSIPPSKVQFVEQDSQTLDELASGVENDKEVVGYMERFDQIKENIKKDPSYNSRGDIRSLVGAIERSDISNKFQLSQQMRDLEYYQFNKVHLKAEYKNKGAIIVGSILGILGFSYLVSKFDQADNWTEGQAFWITTGILSLCSIGGLKKVMEEAEVDYYQKTYHHPFSGKSEIIEDYLERPK